jgi:uncharacterized membrane protein YphA (DoxX/SURF4 family)
MNVLGHRVYGAAAILLGLIGLWWGDFASTWQPVPDDTPHRQALAYAAALVFVIAGAALQWRRSARPAALVLAALYAVFMLLWLRRVIGFPGMSGTWLGCAEELGLVVGGIVAAASLDEGARAATIAHVGRIVFGICLVVYAMGHFLNLQLTAAMVPGRLPPDAMFWAIATGIGHLAAGIALISGVWARLAAILATAMFAAFGLLVWLPMLLAHPAAHINWGGSAVTLALVGSVWIVADAIARFRLSLPIMTKPVPAARAI